MSAVGRRGLAVVGAVLGLSGMALSGCGGDSAPAPPEAAPALTVTSTAFAEGGAVPAEFTCAGAGRRPPLAWSGDLHAARALAVIVDDPDAPSGDFYHWIVVDLPAGTASLGDNVPAGARELENSGGTAGWTPPCPPSGTHHYRFTVYGLSAATGLSSGTPPGTAVAAIAKAATVQGRLTATVTHQP
jgi:Raf kinase inhibitor-like YbhB/YbcL family protein